MVALQAILIAPIAATKQLVAMSLPQDSIEPNVNFSNSNNSEELTSKILNLNDDKSLSSQTETQNTLSGDPNSVPVFIPPVVVPPPVVIQPPPPPPELPPPPQQPPQQV